MTANPVEPDPGHVREAAQRLKRAEFVYVSTGAGMSAESGVPTFRDAAGMWSNFNPAELATPQAFQRDPKKVWAWYRWRRSELARVQPHAGHRVLAAWERRFVRFTLVTQNVDGLHHRAGSTRVLELHGRLDVARCIGCEKETIGLDDLGEDPHCAHCGKRMRPGVVWFGENLPPAAIAAAEQAAAACDVFISIGTSGIVYPAASLIETALAQSRPVIEINPNATPFSGAATVRLAAPCGAALTAIDACLRSGDVAVSPA